MLPPGPRLPKVVQTAGLLIDPFRLMWWSRRRYGRVFRIHFVGLPGIVYVADPDLAHQIFATDRDIGDAGRAREDFLEPLVGPHSLLTLDGESWTRQRKRHGAAFHGRRLRSYEEPISSVAAEHIRGWPAGRPIPLRPRMQAITLEVIIRVVFGITDAPRLRRLQALLPRLLSTAESAQIVALLLPAAARTRVEGILGRIPGTSTARFHALRAAVDRILFEEIARRRAGAHGREESGTASDVLSGLMSGDDEIGDDELRDALVTLLVAGHETTATALAWCFERLVRHPRVYRRLSESLAAGERDYLDAVIKETLRVRPVVADMPRILREPMTLGRYRIPAGWMVSPAAPLIHESPELFTGPDEFRPERFLEDDVPQHAWMPFGGGRRQCLGAQFAMLEMATVIPEVLARWHLAGAGDPGGERRRVRHVTLAPARDGLVIARVGGSRQTL